MKPASKPQHASLDLAFGAEPPKPHCPICGHAVVVADENEGNRVDACPHLAFVFIGETADFEYRSPDFLKRSAGRRISQLDVTKISRFLERVGYGNRLLALEITHGGMACGPVWYTDVYGFDFESLAGDDIYEDESFVATEATKR